jgi:transposase
MARNRHTLQNSFIIGTFEEFVPQDHLVRKLNEFVDWDFIYDICDPLYSNLGAERIDPVILFKMIFINIIFGIHSMRKTCEECQVNLAYRWFLGLSMDEKIPDHSTFSQNYRRKFKNGSVAAEIFASVISQLMEYGVVDPSVVYVDGTHLKANANKNKCENREIQVAAASFKKELDKDIEQDREAHGKKALPSKAEKEEAEKKEIKVSTSDPDCGYFHKGDKQKCFAYNVNTACDQHGYVLGMSVDPGNVHDSRAFFHLKSMLDFQYGDSIKKIVADAGYSTPGICHTVKESGQEMIVPKKRTASRGRNKYGKHRYKYNEENDTYVCPEGVVLHYSTTDREGYRIYSSSGNSCDCCPSLEKCTSAKNHVKIIATHIWKKDVDEAVARRWDRENGGFELYSCRKQTIERDFADGKRRHGLDYTNYTGYERVYDFTLLTFTGMNLKKLCTYLWNQREKYAQNTSFVHQNEEVMTAVDLL